MYIRSTHFSLTLLPSPWPGYPNLSWSTVLASQVIYLQLYFSKEKLEWYLKNLIMSPSLKDSIDRYHTYYDALCDLDFSNPSAHSAHIYLISQIQ